MGLAGVGRVFVVLIAPWALATLFAGVGVCDVIAPPRELLAVSIGINALARRRPTVSPMR